MFGLGFLGKLGALASSVARAWSPLALWPDGISSAGMWISPRTLDSQWQDYTGTTPVATPGTVADSSNPVGLALDLRAGNPVPLGPELVTNGDFSDGTTGFTAVAGSVLAVTAGVCRATVTPGTGDAGFTFNLSAAPVVGRTYEYTFSIQNISGFPAWVFDGPLNSYVGSGPGVFTFKQVAVTTNTLMYLRSAGGGAAGSYIEFDNISVREVPGNHMLQSTSPARPLLSARVNLLTYSEDFSNAVWATLVNGGATASKTPNYGVAPDGTTTACRVQLSVAVDTELAYFYTPPASTPTSTGSYWLKTNDGSTKTVAFAGYGPHNITVTPTWTQFSGTGAGTANLGVLLGNNTGSASSADLLIWHPQVNLGSTALPYQRVNTASDYTATGFPIAQLYDGVDDGMATAAFAAGTLTSAMDCMIAVRRDSGAQCVAGLYSMPVRSRYFGHAQAGSGGLCSVNVGTPTVWVDGVQLTGGTSVEPGTLNTALTVGAWHIVEFRGLDLSSITQAGWGDFGSGYSVNGPRGDILLYPSTASTEDKDAARQWLADYYGVALP